MLPMDSSVFCQQDDLLVQQLLDLPPVQSDQHTKPALENDAQPVIQSSVVSPDILCHLSPLLADYFWSLCLNFQDSFSDKGERFLFHAIFPVDQCKVLIHNFRLGYSNCILSRCFKTITFDKMYPALLHIIVFSFVYPIALHFFNTEGRGET